MWNVVKRIFPTFKQHPFLTTAFFTLVLIASALSLFVPYVLKNVTDSLINVISGNGKITDTYIFAALYFAFALVLRIVESSSAYTFWTIMNYAYFKRANDLFNKMIKKDVQVFNQYKGGYLIETLVDGADADWQITNSFVNQLFPSLLLFTATIGFAFYFSAKLTIVLLLSIPIQLLFSRFIYSRTKVLSKESESHWRKGFAVAGDVFQNVYAVKSYAKENYELNRISKLWSNAVNCQRKINKQWMLNGFLRADVVARAAVLLFGSYLVYIGDTTVGTIFMFIGLIHNIIGPIDNFSDQLPHMQRSMSKIDLLEEVLETSSKILDSSGVYKQKRASGHYVLKNVSFFHGNRKTLASITCEIKAGERVALVGPSGAGKSTLALLLARFYDPDSGVIKLDGVDLKKWNYDDLRKHIGIVWQENMLFHETLKHNLMYGKHGSSIRNINDALKKVSLSKFIKRQKKGLAAVVGERGIRLSGGEKQRVMIARALIKNPDIVILDEATSALDSLTEREVQKGIDQLISGRTAVIIAHRLSTIRNVDRIFVIDKGKIVADGSHDELVKTCELYKQMVELQSCGLLGKNR